LREGRPRPADVRSVWRLRMVASASRRGRVHETRKASVRRLWRIAFRASVVKSRRGRSGTSFPAGGVSAHRLRLTCALNGRRSRHSPEAPHRSRRREWWPCRLSLSRAAFPEPPEAEGSGAGSRLGASAGRGGMAVPAAGRFRESPSGSPGSPSEAPEAGRARFIPQRLGNGAQGRPEDHLRNDRSDAVSGSSLSRRGPVRAVLTIGGKVERRIAP
jgi:hypothetical protein